MTENLQTELFSDPDYQPNWKIDLGRPVARLSDPRPSHQAAAEVTASGQRQAQASRVLEMLRRFPLCTSLELAEASGIDRYIVARRLPELEAARLVSRRTARICSYGKRLATTWEAK